jgi:hypothetical protein
LDYYGEQLTYAYSRNSSDCQFSKENSGEINAQKQLLHHRHEMCGCFINKCGLLNLIRSGGRNDVRPIASMEKLDSFTLERGECRLADEKLVKSFVRLFNSTQGAGILKASTYNRIGSQNDNSKQR